MTGKSLLTVKAYDIQAHGWVKDRKSHFFLFFTQTKLHTFPITSLLLIIINPANELVH